VHIRLAHNTDLSAIATLSRAEIEHEFDWHWTPARLRKAMSDTETNVAVAITGNELLGFGIMQYRHEYAHLLLFAVRPNARRRGIGSALLKWLERVAVIAGINTFRIEARHDNASALAFYRAHGYREIAKVLNMYEGLEDGVRLEKRIK